MKEWNESRLYTNSPSFIRIVTCLRWLSQLLPPLFCILFVLFVNFVSSSLLTCYILKNHLYAIWSKFSAHLIVKWKKTIHIYTCFLLNFIGNQLCVFLFCRATINITYLERHASFCYVTRASICHCKSNVMVNNYSCIVRTNISRNCNFYTIVSFNYIFP